MTLYKIKCLTVLKVDEEKLASESNNTTTIQPASWLSTQQLSWVCQD